MRALPLVVAWSLVLPTAALGQGGPGRVPRQIEDLEQARRSALASTALPKASRRGNVIDYGGWVSTSLYTFDDTDAVGFGKDRTFRNHDLRLWANGEVEDLHQVYLRGRGTYVDFNPGDSFEADDDAKDLDIDQAFYRLNFVGLARRGPVSLDSIAPVRELALEGTVGRQYVYLGTGLVLNKVGDGGLLRADMDRWGLHGEAFAIQSIRAEDDLDRSLPRNDRSERRFFGGTLSYTGTARHRPYAFFLLEQDLNDAFDPSFPTSDFDYQARYAGLGSRGEAILDVQYRAELIAEGGTSRSDPKVQQPNVENDIRAYAANTGVDYYLDQVPTTPRLSFDWLYGSGDEDREAITNTVGGNRPRSLDHGFLGFGYTPTGFALSPTLSNLHIFRARTSLRPFQEARSIALREMQCDVAYYFFYKDTHDGAISDFRAVKDAWIVGNEWDASAYWQVMSDLTVSLQYGVFFQGQTYDERDQRHFFSYSINYSF